MIRVFPHKTEATPIDEQVYFTGPPLEPLEDRDVYVSVLFTYHKERAKMLADQWDAQGYNVHLGGPAFDDYGGDFVPGRFVGRGYVITSRGCNNRCWFCSVWKREGGIRELPIVDGFNVLDSNLLQCSEGHIRNVFAMLKRQPERARFTGGLEARVLQDWHVDLLVDLKPKQMYFAYDTEDDYEPLVRAAGMVTDAGFKRDRVSCYTLVGYPKDTMERAEKRLRQVVDLGITPMAMLYRDNRGEVDTGWRRFQRRWVRPHIIFSKTPEHYPLFDNS